MRIMRKKLFQWVRKAGVWIFTKLFGAALTTGAVVSIGVFIRSLWEELSWSQRSVVSIAGFAVSVYAIKGLWSLCDFVIERFRRSFKIRVLDPQEEEIANSSGNTCHWYRLSVHCTDQTAEIKSLKCRVGEIIPDGD